MALVTAAVDTLRDSHYVYNPATGLYERSVLLEAARTNAWSFSQTLANAVWNKVRSSVVANVAIAPDGTVTADKWVEDTSASTSHYLIRGSGTFTAGQKQTFSTYLQSAGRSLGRFYMTDNVDSSFGVSFDLTAGTAAPLTSGPNGVLDLYEIGAVPGAPGWYRLAITGHTEPTRTSGSVVVMPHSSGINTSYTGDGVSGFHVWGLQAELDQPFSTSYFATPATAATRDGDSFSLPFTRDGAETGVPVPVEEGTFYVRWIERGTAFASGSLRIFQVGEPAGVTGSTIRLILYGSGTGAYYVQYSTRSGSKVAGPLGFGTVAMGSQVEARVTLRTNGTLQFGLSVNGGTEFVSQETTAFAMAQNWGPTPRVYLGGAGAPALAGYMALLGTPTNPGFKYRPGAQSMDAMRALTA